MKRLPCVLAVVCVLLGARAVAAQEAPPLAVTFDPANGQRGLLNVGGVLADDELENAIRSGLPLRIRFRVELWKDEFLDDQVGAEEWTTVLTFDPLSELYIVRRRSSTPNARAFTQYRGAREAIEGTYPLTLRPPRRGRYYYTAAVDIETLSLSDLEELERWLKGELQPAVAGDRSIPGALGQGARRLFMRVLSLPERRFEARSERFRVP